MAVEVLENCSARIALLGTSHIMIRRRPWLPALQAALGEHLASRARPVSRCARRHMISMLSRPMSLRARFRLRIPSRRHR